MEGNFSICAAIHIFAPHWLESVSSLFGQVLIQLLFFYRLDFSYKVVGSYWTLAYENPRDSSHVHQCVFTLVFCYACGCFGMRFETFDSDWPRSGWIAEIGRSCTVGFAAALELIARARSASLERFKWPLEPARPCFGTRNGRSGPLGLAAEAGEINA